jgi:hypothetical protein
MQVFAYPGGASMEIHQALTRSPVIQNYLCRHEQVWHSAWVVKMPMCDVNAGVRCASVDVRVHVWICLLKV